MLPVNSAIPFVKSAGGISIPDIQVIPGYIPRFFKPCELVSRDFFGRHSKTPERIYQQFDPRILWTADALREIFGPATINDWASGGKLQWCGLRTPGCGVGSDLSQHHRGASLDLHFINIVAEEVRKWIRANPNHPACRFITCLEIDITWLHIDCRNWDKAKNGILLVKPS